MGDYCENVVSCIASWVSSWGKKEPPEEKPKKVVEYALGIPLDEYKKDDDGCSKTVYRLPPMSFTSPANLWRYQKIVDEKNRLKQASCDLVNKAFSSRNIREVYNTYIY